jgi:two-component system sensor histidine kinase KdpD
LDVGYLAKPTETDKGGKAYIAFESKKGRSRSLEAMPRAEKFARLRTELRGIVLALCLVAVATATIDVIIHELGLTRGTVIFLIPVVIAATRWGVVSALVAAIAGVMATAYLFFPPYYSFRIRDPQEVINLLLFVFVAFVVSQLATRLTRQLEVSRQREIDMRDLYAFSRRLALAFDVGDIHAAIEDHLAAVMQRKVVLFAGAREAAASSGHHAGVVVPAAVLAEAANIAAARRETASGLTVRADSDDIWLVRAVSSKSLEFGVIAINLGQATPEASNELRVRVDAVLADATATLERLDVAHAISEARMRAQTDLLREALIGSVSHELRTPLASILGAATVLSDAPAIAGDKKLKALANDVRDEAERLNNDIQNLLDASRISSDGVRPHIEWAEPADIVNSALERCRNRMAGHSLAVDLPQDLPLVHVDSILVKQALVQIFDNAVKYSVPGSQISVSARAQDDRLILSIRDEGAGLTPADRSRMWDRFARGERHTATTSGSGLGLWIANAFIATNGGKMTAASAGAGMGTTVAIDLPVTQAAVPQLESDTDE